MIAECCGAEVAEAARTASVALCGKEREDESLNALLLADVKGIFGRDGVDRIAWADLARKLAAVEESPWVRVSAESSTPARSQSCSSPSGYDRAQFALRTERRRAIIARTSPTHGRGISHPPKSRNSRHKRYKSGEAAWHVTDVTAVTGVLEAGN